jgi:transposase
MSFPTRSGASFARCCLPSRAASPRVDDRRVLNGIFWVLRSCAPWRDLPTIYGPRTTCYNRSVRWRRAGIWDRILKALTCAHNAVVQMIDTSMVRVHQHAAWIADSGNQAVGRSRGGLTSKLHVVVDGKGLPLRLGITAGQAHDNRLCSTLLSGLTPRTGCSLIEATMPVGSGHLSTNKVPGPTFRRNAIAGSSSASVPTFIEHATTSSASSTRSSIAGVSPRATTNSQPTTYRSSS